MRRVELREVFMLRRVRGLELLNFLGWKFSHRFGAYLLEDNQSGNIDSRVKLTNGEILERPQGF